MNIIRNTFVAFGIVLVAAGLMYGTLRPLYGAYVIRQSFNALEGRIAIEQFKNIFTAMLTAAKPVGETEVLLRLISSTDQIIKDGASLASSEDLLRFSERYTRPVFDSVAADRYVDTRLLWALAALYTDAGRTLHNQDNLDRAEYLYRFGLRLAPRRPEFLYGLFDFYVYENRRKEAEMLGNDILRYWPFEKEISDYVNSNP